ncbi:MAG TPA: YajG family lipoprotein [Candidatus Binataceae bacterium]|nr:YajG family lipoprotein [Candidatus Binataceae bacterium]
MRAGSGSCAGAGVAALAALLLVCLAGCANQQPTTVPLVYTEESFVPPTQGAEGIPVQVEVVDERPDKSRVGEIPSRDSSPDTPIVTANDPDEVIRKAMEHELSVRGFNVTPSPVRVNVAVTKLWADYAAATPIPPRAQADVTLKVLVIGPHDQLFYSQTLNGQGQHGQVLASDHAGPALSRALDDAITNVFSDEKFTRAIITASRER